MYHVVCEKSIKYSHFFLIFWVFKTIRQLARNAKRSFGQFAEKSVCIFISKQGATYFLEKFYLFIKLFFFNLQLFRKTSDAEAVLLRRFPVYQPTVKRGFVTRELFAAALAVAHLTFTSFAVRTLQPPASTCMSMQSLNMPRCSPVKASVTSKP